MSERIKILATALLMDVIFATLLAGPYMLIWNYGFAPGVGFQAATYAQAWVILFIAYTITGRHKPEEPK